jgi:hypothetical protein
MGLPQASAAPKDRTAPTVLITSPADGASIISKTSSILIQGTASDNIRGSGVKVVEVRVDEGSYIAAIPKTSEDWSSWTATVNVGSTGNHRITSRATDNAGHQAWNAIYINVVVDGSAPSVTITSPANGATVPLTTLLVQGTSSDILAAVGSTQFRCVWIPDCI